MKKQLLTFKLNKAYDKLKEPKTSRKANRATFLPDLFVIRKSHLTDNKTLN